MSKNVIRIEGASSNNLKNVSLEIPRDAFVVVTGLSGSGKSSLVFDTIYAEGRRRYLDTLSPYAKHFIGYLDKPAVESIEGLSPIIAIEQKTTGNNPRSTVGTITEIYDFLRLLYAKASVAYSPQTGKPMVKYTDEQIVELIMERYQGRKCYLLAPLVSGRKGHYKELFAQMRKRGYTYVRVDGKIEELAELESVDRYKNHFIELVVDRLKPSGDDTKRVRDSVVSALNFGKGSLCMLDDESGQMEYLSKNLVCPDSGISMPQPQPFTFSFNSPQGYCPHCKGLGQISDVRMENLVPDMDKSIADGGIVPLGKYQHNKKFELIRAIARKYGFSLSDPIGELPEEALSHIIFGSEDLLRVGEGLSASLEAFPGLVADIEEKVVCPVCGGTRLKKEASYFKIDGKTISEVSAMEISQLQEWLADLDSKLGPREQLVARDILRELRDRVGFLVDVGLEYLSLSRATASLSGGESQRIRLATQIGSKLVNVLYILDEPSIGLHQCDNRKLIASLKRLRDEGNSVMVVEHDAETILAADWLVDVGPGAGEDGGYICYNGPASASAAASAAAAAASAAASASAAESITLRYLRGESSISSPAQRSDGNGHSLILRDCSGNNLRHIDFRIPLGCLVGVCGVSGSGKSTLINETLVPLLSNRFFHTHRPVLACEGIEGAEHLDKIIVIDQSPIGKTPRSNPATFTEVFTDIRALFENTNDARARGFKSGRFSFNVPGGRCEACKGAGIKMMEMNYLPSVRVVCPECGGKRYNEATLAVKYKGKSINDVLEMSVDEACDFFEKIPKIHQRLRAMKDVGLGYVRLGQSTVTLSGGECQRMKLAAELGRKGTGRTLYVLDEPTTGLHFEDIKILLDALGRLVALGNSVLVIEHNLDVLKNMDYLVDMGPGGGYRGGQIVAEGTPEALACNPNSVTGPFLKEILSL
ncbi:MAG: excinuclease ABC subunit UvrA [Bacteroidales bacterium]|nr:excinuclease ABC subunit UvrA [Bacteroidales bacterium]